MLRHRLHQSGAGGGGRIDELVGDGGNLILLTEILSSPEQSPHPEQIDHAPEFLLDADRQLQGHRQGTELRRDRGDDGIIVRADAVEFIDETDRRHAPALRLPPDGLGLRLHPGDTAENGHGAVENAERALDLDREIHVPRRIDEVDLVLAPGEGRGRRGDRDAALLLLGHPVHRRGAVVDLADLVAAAGVVEEALGDRRLAGIDVRNDTNIARARDRRMNAHGVGLPGIASAAVFTVRT